MTFEELNRAMEFMVEQQARLSATLDREEERSRRDHEWATGMIKQLATNNQSIVDLIASNAQRLDENDKEHHRFHHRFLEFQNEAERKHEEFQKKSQRRHEQIVAQLQRLLDRLTQKNQKPN